MIVYESDKTPDTHASLTVYTYTLQQQIAFFEEWKMKEFRENTKTVYKENTLDYYVSSEYTIWVL